MPGRAQPSAEAGEQRLESREQEEDRVLGEGADFAGKVGPAMVLEE